MKIRLVILVTTFLFICQVKAQNEPSLLYEARQDPQCKLWVDQMMSQMSLKEKVGQLFIYTIAPQNTKKNLSLLQEVVRTYKIGGLLFSGGRLRDQALLTNYAQENAKTPLLITFDGEWGLSMRLKGTPRFPKNMALGCIQDNELIYEYGREVARECKELGIHVNFAPVADVNINPDNPVINTRSFGEDPRLVAEKVIAYARGLESGGVLSVSKHFPGHGDTDVDSHKALPVLPFSRARLDSIELYPFKEVIKAGLGGIMVGHLQVPSLGDPLLPASLSKKIISDVLLDELKFKGLVFTDALAMKGVSENKDLCVKALLAGNDLLLVPRRIKVEMESVMKALDNGVLTEEMINEKCRKVLTYKYALGANRKKKINLSGLDERISTPESKELIRKLHAASLTILGNKRKILPFHYSADTLIVISVGEYQSDTSFMRQLSKYVPVRNLRLTNNMNDSLRRRIIAQVADRKKVVVSITTREVKKYGAFLATLTLNAPTVYAVFTPFTYLDRLSSSLSAASAVVVGHSNEEYVQKQVADILFGMTSANGKLSASIPKLFSKGEGITITPATPRYYAPEELGMNAAILTRIDSIANDGIQQGAFPGCRVYVLKNGETVYDKCFGTFTYGKGDRQVQPNDLYDLASLSKTTGTLLAVMKMYDKGKLNLSDKLSDYLPYMQGTDKANITINELLLHESGLPAGIAFYKEAIDEDSYKGTFFRNKKDASHPIQVGRNTYVRSDYKFKKGLVSKEPSDTYNIEVADDFWLNRSFRKEEERLLAEAPLKGKNYRYSCVNFILLKEIVEHIAGESMDKLLEREFFRPMKLNRLTYLPLRKFPKSQLAPTVKNDFLRRNTSILQGYVHDETAAFFGGISGNAGLFGSAADVAAVYQMLIDGGTYKGRRYLSEATCRLFTTVTSKISRRGLGFDKPDTKDPDKSPCAEDAPASVFGHTGFTGTCAWADPDNNLVYVFLSNRIYPNVWNNKLGSMNIRPKIQQVLYDALMK